MKSANRLSLNYQTLAREFRRLEYPIIDVHSHIQGQEATAIYARAAEEHGIGLTYSMTPLKDVPTVKKVLGDRIEFISIPDFSSKDRRGAVGEGYKRQLPEFRKYNEKWALFGAGYTHIEVIKSLSQIAQELPMVVCAVDAPPQISSNE